MHFDSRSLLPTMLLVVTAIVPLASPAAEQLTRAQRAGVLHAVADMLEARYVFPDRAARLAPALRQAAENDELAHATDGKSFAKEVSRHMFAIAGDGHLHLDFTDRPSTAEPRDEAFERTEMQRWYGAHVNHGVERVERLPSHIGYLDLRVFAPPAMAGDVIASTMTLLAQMDALIIDLRRNGGGSGTDLWAGYLFDDKPRPLSGTFTRATGVTTYSQTPSWVPGRRFGADKPVFILISRQTFSAAEAFAYDLKALGRAVIVGEPSGGGANPFEYRQVAPGFFLSLSEQLSVNPITGGNWQDTGVKPDVVVPAERALETATLLAKAALERRR